MADKGLEDIEQSQIESNYDETVDSFDEMALKAELLRGKMILHTHTPPLLPPPRHLLCARDKSVKTLWVNGYTGTDMEHRCLRLWLRASVCYSAARYHARH